MHVTKDTKLMTRVIYMIFLTLCLCVRAPCVCLSVCLSLRVLLYVFLCLFAFFYVCCIYVSASSFTCSLYFCLCVPVSGSLSSLLFGFIPLSLSDGLSGSQALKEEDVPSLNPPQLRKGRFQVGETTDPRARRGLS